MKQNLPQCAMQVGEHVAAHREAGVDRPDAHNHRGGKAEPAGPFRTWHASTRHRPVAHAAPQPRLACQALPDPTNSTSRQQRRASEKSTQPQRRPRAEAARSEQACRDRRRQRTCLQGRGWGVGQGLAREARRKPCRRHSLSSCARVTSPERRHGGGLAATAQQRSSAAAPPRTRLKTRPGEHRFSANAGCRQGPGMLSARKLVVGISAPASGQTCAAVRAACGARPRSGIAACPGRPAAALPAPR